MSTLVAGCTVKFLRTGQDSDRLETPKENRWYAVRIHGTMRPQIQYIAAYRVAPISAITHIAPVRSIEPWKDTAKFVLNFAEPAREIGPISLVKGSKGKAPQNLRYTNRQTIEQAKTLDDIW
jgi:hypothetical protein